MEVYSKVEVDKMMQSMRSLFDKTGVALRKQDVTTKALIKTLELLHGANFSKPYSVNYNEFNEELNGILAHAKRSHDVDGSYPN